MQFKLLLTAILCTIAIPAYGDTLSDNSIRKELSAGQSVTLLADQTIYVPSGTTIRAPNGATVIIKGHLNNVNTSEGAVVSVSTSASGPADNTVVAK